MIIHIVLPFILHLASDYNKYLGTIFSKMNPQNMKNAFNQNLQKSRNAYCCF